MCIIKRVISPLKHLHLKSFTFVSANFSVARAALDSKEAMTAVMLSQVNSDMNVSCNFLMTRKF